MHVIVIGAGAIGTLYGAWLLSAGEEVSFVARGRQLDALRSTGVRLSGNRGDLETGPVRASDRAADLPRADVVLLTVKLYDLDAVAGVAAECLKPGGLVVGVQNGVSAFEMLRRTFASEQIVVGSVYTAAGQAAPGVVHYSGARHRILLGNPDGHRHPALDRLVAAWQAAGVEGEVSPDIVQALWTKFLGFGTNAALTCLSRQPAGIVYHDPDLLALARATIAEILAVGRAEGVAFSADPVEDTIRLLQSFPPEMVASMRQDLDAGRRLELDGITGAIRDLGRRHGVATPIHEVAYACLKSFRNGAS